MVDQRNTPAGSEFWQVIFPLILGILVVVFLGVWVVLEVSPGNISRFSEISTILLVIPYMAFSLVGLVLLVALIALTAKIITGLPAITEKILDILERIRTMVKRISGYSVAPIIRPKAFLASLTQIFKKDNTEIQID